MTLPEILALAQAVRQVPAENLRSAVIDETMTIPWKTPLGWDVLLPRPDRIRDLVNDLFPVATP